jgi:hypothetical protein
MTTPHGHDFGSVSDEAGRLLDAVQVWARNTFGEGSSARMSTGATECEWCPLCQLVSVLRGDRPEATEKIVAAGTAIMTALRSLLDQPAPPADDSHPRVQRIDLSDQS